MPGDVTILEGPVTPAPIFAYRAIRSIFFASPESSPEHYNYNKENIIPTFTNSPSKTNANVHKSPKSTPLQKRKRDELVVNGGAVLSPTKGILRTPGLATPRAKSLRDVNVKFKSVSPEFRRVNAAVKNNGSSKLIAQNTPQDSRPAKSTGDPVIAQPAQWETTPLQNEADKPIPATSTRQFTPATIEAYMTQTEKEMKRLIRYGKKMREYALKKDAENQELKIMIDDLRRENERLRLGAAASDNNNGKVSLDVRRVEKELGKKSTRETEIIKSKAISPTLENNNRGYVREEVDRVETTVKSQVLRDVVSRQRASSSTANRERVTSLRASTTQQACSSPALRAPTGLPSNPPNSQPQQFDAPSASLPIASRKDAPANTGTLRLGPDRAAAARERLRKRAQARKARGEIGARGDKDKIDEEVAFQQNGKVKKGETGHPSEEQSDLWANL